jgi:hypothetical protein
VQHVVSCKTNESVFWRERRRKICESAVRYAYTPIQYMFTETFPSAFIRADHTDRDQTLIFFFETRYIIIIIQRAHVHSIGQQEST